MTDGWKYGQLSRDELFWAGESDAADDDAAAMSDSFDVDVDVAVALSLLSARCDGREMLFFELKRGRSADEKETDGLPLPLKDENEAETEGDAESDETALARSTFLKIDLPRLEIPEKDPEN